MIAKEAKINTLKCLRKYTDFSKSTYEDILKENFDLKARIIDLMHQAKIMKVAIAKLRCQKPSNNQLQSMMALSVSESSSSGQVRLSGKQKIPPLRKSGASSVSTAASEHGDERLVQEISSLKRQLAEKEHDFKVQMSRMKIFYDKHLLELNQLKLNKPKVEAKKTTEEVKTEEEKKESELRSLRSKVRERDTEIMKLQEEVKQRDIKVIDLKNRIANQGFTKLSKVIEDLKAELQTKEETVKARDLRILQIDSLEYQLANKYPENGATIKRLVSIYLTVNSWLTQDRVELGNRFARWIIDTWNQTAGYYLYSLTYRVWVWIKENLKPVSVEDMLNDEIGKWTKRMGDDKSQAEQIFKLKQEIESLNEQISDYKTKFDAIVYTDGDYRAILCRTL